MKDILKKRSWKVYAFMLGIFFFFFFLSYLSSKYLLETEPEKIEEFMKQFKSSPVISRFEELLSQGKYLDIALLIFLHNSELALLNYFLGIGFLFAVIIQASNGFLVGFLLGVSPHVFSNLIVALSFIAVLILELTALTATAVEGMYLTYSIIRPERMWKTKSKLKSAKKTFSQSIRVLLFALILLLIAALIETLAVHYLSSLDTEAIMI
jgi:uncharacterized membrane protein SpoIIM required for sporulation